MKILLDTHAFLWWITEDKRLSYKAIEIIRDADHEIFLSVVSGWEIVIKTKLKKLSLPTSPQKFILQQIKQNNFTVLPIQMKHALAVYSLPNHHEDPFDRLLIAQSITEKIPLMTADTIMKKYRVSTVW